MPFVALACLALAHSPAQANKKHHKPHKPAHVVREQTKGPNYGNTPQVQALSQELAQTYHLPALGCASSSAMRVV